MITLYAITDYPTPPLPDPDTVDVVVHGDLAAVCGPDAEGDVTPDALWQHERIVEALMKDRDVLPVRYGTRVPDAEAVTRALQDNHDAFAKSLQSVRGAVELAVRVFSADEPPQTPAAVSRGMSGTAYLRARARTAAKESHVAEIVHKPLAAAARKNTTARVERPGELLRGSYLVDRDAVDAFSARVRRIQENNPQLQVTCTGPWPPYSFVT